MNRKLIAILRGVTPEQAYEVVEVILGGGIEWLEVTTNSPNYLESIKKICEVAKHFPQSKIGAGTISTVEQVEKAKISGASFIVSPNTNPEVIRHTKNLGLTSVPGCYTPSEAFTAIENGADILKLFPTGWLTDPVQAIKHLKAVLPVDVQIYAVGGVVYRDYLNLLQAGFDGIGVGSDLFKPGQAIDIMRDKVSKTVESYDQALQTIAKSEK